MDQRFDVHIGPVFEMAARRLIASGKVEERDVQAALGALRFVLARDADSDAYPPDAQGRRLYVRAGDEVIPRLRFVFIIENRDVWLLAVDG